MSEPTPRDTLIARYLDGLLEGDELREFESALASDASLRSSVELDRRIADRLDAMLHPGAAFSIRGNRENASSSNSNRQRWRPIGAIAAALVIVAAIGITYRIQVGASGSFASATREPIEIYRTTIERGFEPAWVCEDDAQMLSYTRERFGRGLLFEPVPGLTLVGWGYANGVLSDLTLSLLVEHGKERILLLVDRSRDDRALEDPALTDPTLHMFRRKVGRFVLYEVTPRDRPLLLDAAYTARPDLELAPGQQGPGIDRSSRQ